MADLSIIQDTSSIAAIDCDYEARRSERDRLGLSEIGDPCARVLWYKHNKYQKKEVKGRVLRLFQLGNLIEEQMSTDLKSAGFLIHSQQRRVVFTQGELELNGSIDGIVERLLESDQSHLWECKSMASKGFAKLKAHGYEAYDQKYKTQIHVYAMGLKLKRIFVTVYNKDTSELYQERIHTNKAFATEMLQRAFDVVGSKTPPPKINERAEFYSCSWCDFKEYCHYGKQGPVVAPAKGVEKW